MIEKLNYESQLERYYRELKTKKFYSTTQIIHMVGICKRTMRSRLAKLKTKYKNMNSMLYMKDNKWHIHRDLVHYFLPKYKAKTQTLYNQDWRSFITWATKDDYDKEYHEHLIDKIQQKLPGGRFYWAIEQTKNGVNHVHMVSDLSQDKIDETINLILSDYISEQAYRLEVVEILNKINVIDYIQKDR